MSHPTPAPLPSRDPVGSSLTARMRARQAEHAAERVRMTPADHAAEQTRIDRARVNMRRAHAAMASRDGFHRDAAGLTAEAARLPRVPTVGSARRPRPRGAGRPRAHAARRASTGRDDGDGGADEPPSALPAEVADDARRILDRAARRMLDARLAEVAR